MEILFKNINMENLHRLEVYEQQGGYRSLKKAFEKQPEEIVEMVKASVFVALVYMLVRIVFCQSHPKYANLDSIVNPHNYTFYDWGTLYPVDLRKSLQA